MPDGSLPRCLFPPIEPYASGRLRVSTLHELYWEQCGNPAGVPVLFLHGGPGSGCSANHRRFFNPARSRVVLFDQRGSGRSTPIAEIADNTTDHLVDDIEALRQQLGIERWLVFGGSWGSTLALAYAEAHPERVTGLILRGIWLCRECDLVWWIERIGHVYPEEWRIFADFIPEAERGDLLTAYHRRLVDPDPAVHMPAAQIWKAYESNSTRIAYDPARRSTKPPTPTTLAMARIEAHYFVNKAFLAPDQLLARADALRDLLITIVHGRYDMVCPIDNAFALSQRLPHAEFHISPFAGHSVFEPDIAATLVAATEKHLSALS